MEKGSTSIWKLRLAALGLGILAVPVIYLIAFKISNDIRLISVSGIVFLFCAGVWLGRKNPDWLCGIVLVGPVATVFGFEVLNKVPALWPNVVLWVATAILGLFFLRSFRSRIGLCIGLIAALLAAAIWFCGWYTPQELTLRFSRTTNISAPEFNLQGVRGDLDPSSPGKIRVLDFFSTTCAPCIAELPELMAAQAELRNRPEIQFVLVASDKGNDTPAKFRAFAERRHVTIPLAFDPEGKAYDKFGLRGVPALVVLDRAGRVRFTHEGFNPAEANFRRDLVQFLKSL